jgi:hypothetical protein
VVVLALGAWIQFKNKKLIDAKFWFVALFFFFLFQFVMFATWDWDNIKILFWIFLVLLIPARDYLKKEPLWVQSGMAIAILASGFFTVVKSLQPFQNGSSLYSQKENLEAKASVLSTPVNSAFVIFPTFNHPVSFWGRAVVMGYDGHIWSHGVDEKGRKKKVESVYKGDPNWREVLKELGATHIFWGPKEKMAYGEGLELEWRKALKNVSLSPGVDIYEVQ